MKKIPQFDQTIERIHKECILGRGLRASLSKLRSDDVVVKSESKTFLENYLDAIDGYIETRNCLIAPVEEITSIVKDVEKRFFKWNPISSTSDLGKLNEKLESVFGYELFRDKKGHKKDPWGGEVLMRKLLEKIRYCPYCNAETVYAIEMVSTGKGKPPLIKSAFDHFFPKGRYPFLSVSLYNLIPSCYRCNSQFKKDKYKDLVDTPNPYQDDIDNTSRFVLTNIPISIWNGAEDDEALEIDLVPLQKTMRQRIENYNNVFQIRKVYNQLCRREAIEALQKSKVLGSGYIAQVKEWFEAAGLSAVDTERLLFSTSLDRNKIDQYRCSKLIQDMREFWGGKSGTETKFPIGGC